MVEQLTTYGTARFYIAEAFYTIAEIEDMVAEFKAAKVAQDKALAKSMERMK